MYEWGCKAENGIASAMSELSRFMLFWGAQNHILYYQRTSRTFLVIPALSCINTLLKEVATRLPKFFNFVRSDHSFVVHNETGEMTVSVPSVLNKEVHP